MVKVELHVHGKPVSPCGECSIEETVERCIRLGYGGVVITDHFSASAYSEVFGKAETWTARVQNFLTGYERAKAYAGDKIKVYLGMELRFTHTGGNDYLVYGIDEQFLYQNEDFDAWSLEKFSSSARKSGFFFAQAHPFRYGMRIIRPNLLDGIEIYNGHANHNANNEFAALWAQKYGLTPLSGSDYHGGNTGMGTAPGGLVLKELPENEAELVKALKARQYELLC